MDKAITTKDEQTNSTAETQEPEQEAIVSSNPRGKFRTLLSALRPRQWTKNLSLFVGIVFAQRLFTLSSFERASVAFVIFCLASSSIYLFNDLLDLENDQQHPLKRLRPLASGRLPISWAISAIVFLLLACGALIALLFFMPIAPLSDIFAPIGANVLFALSVAAYLLLMTLYSVRLKHVILLDVFIIAGGFVLRILAGAVVIPVSISPWLYLVTILLALFLALSKRRHELVLLQDQASSHRQILKEYNLPMLDQMITIVVSATLMSYSLYTFQGPTGNHRLMVTIPLVLYGMFRYLYLVYKHQEGGSPEEVLLRDRHMLTTVLLCIVIIIVVLYILPQ